MKVSPFMANYSRELKIGSKHKEKRKNRKSNGVHIKDKKSTEKSRSSIKKGIGEDKVTSR